MVRKRVTGVDKVLKNLNKEVQAIEGRTLKGLIRAAIIVRRGMEESSPKIPIDTGNLRASWFTDPHYQGENPVVRLGFTANYAWYVHEMVGANFQRPGSGAKFFEAALKREKKEMLAVIQEEAKIK